MPRRLIALFIACYAIAFAFAAMAAIRWPSLMMAADLILDNNPDQTLENIDWRRIGISYGAPYFLAALSLYAAAVSLSNRRRGAVTWYALGVMAGFPCAFLVDFEPRWWQDPSIGEGMVAGAGATALLLGAAVWVLRWRKPQRLASKPHALAAQISENDPPPIVSTGLPSARTAQRHKAVPPAIALQRARFAEDGRRMLARGRRA